MILYRILRENELIERGLEAKNPESETTVQEFIFKGSDESHTSKYIACCKSLSGLKKFYDERDDDRKRIAKIVLPDDWPCIDLTDSDTIATIDTSFHFLNVVRKYDTVLLTGKISPDCIEYMKNPWINPAAAAASSN